MMTNIPLNTYIELPREPIVRWFWDGAPEAQTHELVHEDREYIEIHVKKHGGRVVKLVEVDDD
jgi:hypothetical protein